MDISLLPADNAYLFGLMLLDLYFTKEELSECLIFPSTKSSKHALDQAKVRTIIGKFLLFLNIINNMLKSTELMKQRFPDENLNLKKFQEKANQKCRDANNYVLIV